MNTRRGTTRKGGRRIILDLNPSEAKYIYAKLCDDETEGIISPADGRMITEMLGDEINLFEGYEWWPGQRGV